ncbi:MAG: hypothetical protein HKN31_12965, partial [Pricia sp.]|nr:hypothetical protein [Pricia sp.]
MSKNIFKRTQIKKSSPYRPFFYLIGILFAFSISVTAQEAQLKGKVSDEGIPVPFVNLYLEGTTLGTAT